jgi:Uma2 family endonuclease
MNSLPFGLEIDYPETDGEPMGESEIHVNWLIRLVQLLRYRYRDQNGLVSGNLILYFVEGEPQRNVCPDVFVVKDCNPQPPRQVFKTWEEGRIPNVVFELTSRSTRRRDEVFKPRIYAEIGVPEYFLYDPAAEFLNPPLQGHRLVEGNYQRIEPDARGRLVCEELDLLLRLDGTALEVIDRASGQRLLTEAETERAEKERERAEKERERAEKERDRAEKERERAEKERERAEKERERAARLAAEAEIERLRKLLGNDAP